MLNTLYYDNTSLNDLEGEVWKYIPGWEHYYMASSLGRIKGVPRIMGVFKLWPEKVIRQHINNNEYLTVGLYKHGHGKTCTVHRLIAKTHVNNPNNLKFVNHKKGNKFDNRATELEWVTKSENEKHKYSVLGVIGSKLGKFGKDHNRSKPIAQFDLEGNLIAQFECSRRASKVANISTSYLCSHLKGVCKSAKGFVFKYI